MKQSIEYQDHPEHFKLLRRAIELIFPIQGYGSQQIEDFIEEQATPYNYKFIEIASESGTALVSANPGRGNKPWNLNYIVPTAWEPRYEIIRSAIEALQLESLQQDVPGLHMTVSEDIPSHNSYFLGLLALAGFQLTSRVNFVAERAWLAAQDTALPDGLTEVEIDSSRLDELADVYHLIHSAFDPPMDAEQAQTKRCERFDYLEDRLGRTDSHRWVAVEHGDQIVGLCFGCDDPWDKALDVVELAVAPTFRRQGLGRYLLIRCLQELSQAFPDPDRRLTVSTFRSWRHSVPFYLAIGFEIEHMLTFASWDAKVASG